MMRAFPYLLSGTTDQLLKAQRRLEKVSGEQWKFDWEHFAFKCSHNVSITFWDVLSDPSTLLSTTINARHYRNPASKE